MQRGIAAAIAIGFCALLVDARGQDLTVATAPPVVVKTTPAAGTVDVDPGLSSIEVVFSKKMDDGGWSIVQSSRRTMPTVDGKPRFDEGRTTCTIPVKLEPGRSYALWINSERFGNFKDRDGRSAIPYLLVFDTKGKKTPAAAVTRESLATAFDALRDDMAAHYSYFALKGIRWQALTESLRQRAIESTSEEGFVSVLKELLGKLHDGHVWIMVNGEQVPTYLVPRPPGNRNLTATLATLADQKRCGQFAVLGRATDQRFGAIILTRQSVATRALVREVVSFIRQASDAPGFLIDLREANGGDESLALEIAREFCARDTVYARSKFRNGPAPTDFTRDFDRTLEAAERPYTKPVVCLIGPGCVSSGEGFAKMLKCLPQVTMVGAPTRGSSGNPRPFALPGLDVAVWYSRWVDMLPDGTPIEGRGIVPEVLVDAPPQAYANGDPTWNKALDVLREKLTPASRPCGLCD
jgi:RNA polymerase sigma-70 factor (ECF subfamily)